MSEHQHRPAEPLEIERKFLIEYPDVERLERLPDCSKIDILQTYLISDDGEDVRVRRWEADGEVLYFKTRKRRVSDLARVELEERLTEADYLRLLQDADPNRRPLRKTRYRLPCGGHCLEIDVYPFWSDRAIAEVELQDEQETIRLPDWLRVIREVTADPNYKNSALAAR